MEKNFFTAIKLIKERIFNFKSSHNEKGTMKSQMQLLGEFCEKSVLKLIKI